MITSTVTNITKWVLGSVFLSLIAKPCFAQRFKATSMDQILDSNVFKSREGRAIEVYEDTNRGGTWPILINANSHGNEKLARDFALWLKQRYESNSGVISKLGLPIKLDIIPSLNPDGLARGTRLNASGVNLNRNFGVLWGFSLENPGRTAFSEPETRSLKTLHEKKSYKLALDIHGYTNWIVLPSSAQLVYKAKASSLMKSVWGNWFEKVSETVSKILPEYEIKTAGTLGDGGAFEDWTFWAGKSWSACLELSGPRKSIEEMSREERINTFRSFERYEIFIAELIQKAYSLSSSEFSLTAMK